MRFFKMLLLAVTIALVFAGQSGTAEAKRVDIVISKLGQKMTVKVDGETEYVWPVSTGAPGYDTPSGKFRPFRMEEDHFSKEWDDAPMPNSIFFTPEGHAIHGSFHVKSLGRRASHGCVRLAPDNAKILYGLVGDAGMSNTSVTIKGGFFDFGYAPSRSFASIGNEIDKTINQKVAKPWWNKSTTKKKADATKAKDVKKPKKVAEKCTTKDGKKVCKKPVKATDDEQG
jgi:L,D-transpeptidase catalytic domain